MEIESFSGARKTLFCLFYFPPFSRVGGRRWAKHIKIFQKLGEDFKVIAGGYDGNSPWDRDCLSYQSKIVRIPVKVHYPFFKQTLPISYIEKFRWQLSQKYNSLHQKYYRGNFWDDSRGYENQFLYETERLLSEGGFTHLILSVGPFSYSRILIKIKKEYPSIKVILDYRDPWEDSTKFISLKKRNYELALQEQVLKYVDTIITVNDELLNFYRKSYPNKFVYKLPHCFDKDDISPWQPPSPKEVSSLNLIYGGALYENIGEDIEVLKVFINKINQYLPTYVNIYASSENYKDQLKHEHIKTNGFINSGEYFKKLSTSDYVILFLPEDRKNAFSSKFYEILAFRRPIIYFGAEGDVSRFLLSKKLGFHFTRDNIEDSLRTLLEMRNDKSYNKDYDLKEHEFMFQTKTFIELVLNS